MGSCGVSSGSSGSGSSGRSPALASGNLTWPLKSVSRGCPTPRTPKGHGLAGESGALLSFGADQGEPVEILPYLYLGSEYHASCKPVLEKLAISALLNVSHTCPNHFEEFFTYKCIPVEDTSVEDIGLHFQEAIEFIGKNKQSSWRGAAPKRTLDRSSIASDVFGEFMYSAVPVHVLKFVLSRLRTGWLSLSSLFPFGSLLAELAFSLSGCK